MSETVDLGVLERIRALEADVERCIDSVVQQQLFRDEVQNARHRMLLDHFALEQADKVQHMAEKLLDAYLDEDDIVRVREAPTLQGSNNNSTEKDDSVADKDAGNVLASAMRAFEARIADIREYHHTYRDVPPIRETLAQPEAALLTRVFALRERHGACLDLEPHYQRYSAFMIATSTLAADCAAEGCSSGSSNDDAARLSALWASHATAWQGGRLDLFAFVPALPRLLLDKMDASRKLAGFDAYASFVRELLAYLCAFAVRVQPLRGDAALQRLLTDTSAAVDAYWAVLQQEAAAVATLNTDRYDDVMAAAAATKHNNGQSGSGSGSGGGGGGGGGGGALTTTVATSDAAEDVAVTVASGGGVGGNAAVHAAKVSCGLRVPPPLRRYVKTFTVWPLQFIQDVLLPLRQAHDSKSDKGGEDGDGTTTTTRAHARTATARAMLATSATAAIASSSSGSNRTAAAAAAAVAHSPRSLDEVKAVCVAEAQVVALLESLLYDALQQTEQTLLREYGKTAEELEADDARAEREFCASLEAVRKLTAATMEGTVAHAAAYDVQAALQHSSSDGGGADDVAASASAATAAGGHGHVAGAAADAAARLLARTDEFVGEDGKPIARWLVKLQQLEKRYVCEVCGGTVYKGPRMFREHFAAERHAEGLRRLGVTQHLKDFEGIAAIRTVVELRDRLAAGHGELRKRLRDDLDGEEMQDGQGKVITTRDYRRFQRQRA